MTAYLAESLETFRKGNCVPSTVMLCIAAERVFLLLCDSLAGALSNASEKAAFTKLLGRFPMKPSPRLVMQTQVFVRPAATAGPAHLVLRVR